MTKEQIERRKLLQQERSAATVKEMAKKYGINQFYISKMVSEYGYEPPQRVWDALGVPAKRRHRRSINLDCPVSAAITILGSDVDDEYIARLAQLLNVSSDARRRKL